MPTKPIDERMHQLEERLKKLRASKRTSEHKNDELRQAIIARVYSKLMLEQASFKEEVMKVLDVNLKRDNERKLFNLAPINKKEKKEEEGKKEEPK